MTEWEALGRVAVAMLFGGVIGFERAAADKPAGTRTHMLVSGAAALVVAIGIMILSDGDGAFNGDATRGLHAVITGIGFLGAGTILQTRDLKVEGLTTATSLFFVAALGSAVGMGYFVIGGGATALAITTLRGVRVLEKRLEGRAGDDARTSGGETPPSNG